jgi:hypothetical protein
VRGWPRAESWRRQIWTRPCGRARARSGANATNYPVQAPPKMASKFLPCTAARRPEKNRAGLTLILELLESSARQACSCSSRAKAICEHLADRKPLASLALRQQHQRGIASTPGLLGAARAGSLVGLLGRPALCVDGGRTWLPEPKATATRRTTGMAWSIPFPGFAQPERTGSVARPRGGVPNWPCS